MRSRLLQIRHRSSLRPGSAVRPADITRFRAVGRACLPWVQGGCARRSAPGRQDPNALVSAVRRAGGGERAGPGGTARPRPRRPPARRAGAACGGGGGGGGGGREDRGIRRRADGRPRGAGCRRRGRAPPGPLSPAIQRPLVRFVMVVFHGPETGPPRPSSRRGPGMATTDARDPAQPDPPGLHPHGGCTHTRGGAPTRGGIHTRGCIHARGCIHVLGAATCPAHPGVRHGRPPPARSGPGGGRVCRVCAVARGVVVPVIGPWPGPGWGSRRLPHPAAHAGRSACRERTTLRNDGAPRWSNRNARCARARH